jgi:hypothetical protein
MKRTHLNALIDATAFVAFLLLLSTGLLLEYHLPPGSGGLQGNGAGRGAADRTIHLIWSWTRHEWGQFHYYIALTMMAILAIHLVLHWKWIVCTVRGKPGNASGYRFALGCLGLIFATLLSAAPLISPATTISRSDLRDLRMPPTASDELSNGNDSPIDDGTFGTSLSIRGSMTLQQISEVSGVPIDDIVQALGLPSDVNRHEGAGRVLRRHNLQMSDMRTVVTRLRTAEPNHASP